jgi:hypothetical protein
MANPDATMVHRCTSHPMSDEFKKEWGGGM